MGLRLVVHSALIALAFVTWPVTGKYSGLNGPWVGVLASVGTLATAASLSASSLGNAPTMKAISILLAAGAINGIGLFFYSVRTTDPQIVTSLFVVTTAVMMVVWAPILDHLFNGSIFSIYQLVGFGVIALGIYLLGR